MESEFFSTADAAAIVGMERDAFYEMFRTGLIRGSARHDGPRAPRYWSFTDLLAVRIAHEWKRHGVNHKAVRRICHHIQEHGIADLDRKPFIVLGGQSVWRAERGAKFVANGKLLACDLRPGVRVLKRRIEHWRATRRDDKPATKPTPKPSRLATSEV